MAYRIDASDIPDRREWHTRQKEMAYRTEGNEVVKNIIYGNRIITEIHMAGADVHPRR